MKWTSTGPFAVSRSIFGGASPTHSVVLRDRRYRDVRAAAVSIDRARSVVSIAGDEIDDDHRQGTETDGGIS